MLSKNTVIELWNEFGKVPTFQTDDGKIVIDTLEGFLGFPMDTDVEDIWHWFDVAYSKWGGVSELLYGNQQPERKFQVETPKGILECYAKHEGVDCQEDFPGIYIDLRHTDAQKSGKEIGNLICCIEYENVAEQLQIVLYPDLASEEPCPGEFMDYDSGVTSIYNYEVENY